MREGLKVDGEFTSEKCRFVPCATRHVALAKIKTAAKLSGTAYCR